MAKTYNNVSKVAISRANIGLCKAFGLKLLAIIATSVSIVSVSSAIKLPAVNAQSVARNRPSTGKWLDASFPVENFQTYTSPFGYRQSPSSGREQFHRGLDLAAPLGSYIRNWWSGSVTKLSDHTACGTMIVIRSGQWEHIYCHLKGRVKNTSAGPVLIDHEGGIRLKEGQQVATGTRIGRIGMTGRTTGPHLHWGLKYAGEYIDPGLVLRQMYQEQAALQ